MAAANLEVFKGGTFVFEVGGAEFIVHKRLISHTSAALLAHIDNKMKESRTGRVILQDVDESTFGRFVEFLYTGDYNPAERGEPAPSKLSPQVEPVSDKRHKVPREFRIYGRVPPDSDEELSFPSEELFGAEIANMNKRRRKRAGLDAPPTQDELPIIPNVHLRVSRPSLLATSSEFPREASLGNFDYTPLIFSHIHLYVFAEKFDISDLCDLTAVRLRESLAFIKPVGVSIPNLMELVRYIHDHTPERTKEVDKLRTVIVQYCANHMTELQTSADFFALVHAGGQFSEVLMREVCKRHKI